MERGYMMSVGSRMKNYVEKFNQQDEELIVQHISNAHALEWMEENVPLFECPDRQMEEIYYFRWWVYRKHIKSTPEGYIITEFLPPVSWAGPYNSINCAAGHHLYEGRWLRNAERYLEDYIYFWMRGSGVVRTRGIAERGGISGSAGGLTGEEGISGNPGSLAGEEGISGNSGSLVGEEGITDHPGNLQEGYSTWIADAVYQYCLARGDFSPAMELLPELIENYRGWEKSSRHESGLFWSVDDRDAMEYSISGNGLRPTLNSYLFADARAIAKLAGMKGDTGHKQEFEAKAEELRRLVQEKLWDPQAGFFKVFPLESKDTPIADWRFEGIPAAKNVREEIGLIPWLFHLPDKGYEKAWLQLMDKEGFLAPFGPMTAERRHPRFMFGADHECLWNGPSWPFATSQTLGAMANVLKDYRQDYIRPEQFHELFRIYTNSHYRKTKAGETLCWLDENLDPFTGEWLSRNILRKQGWKKEKGGYERGKDYNHSTYSDLVISKIVGVEPQEDGSLRIRPMIPDSWNYCRLEGLRYKGKEITVSYDKTGKRYQEGRGWKVWCDGECIQEIPV